MGDPEVIRARGRGGASPFGELDPHTVQRVSATTLRLSNQYNPEKGWNVTPNSRLSLPLLSRRKFIAGSCIADLATLSSATTIVAAPRKVIIDTDPGVDDALALLFAVCSPELKIEAITVVAGNVRLELALMNALRMVQIAGRADIRVSAGSRAPLERRLVTATSHGSNGLGGIDFPVPTIKPADEPATEIIHSVVSGSPGEVSIIAIGPLTNIASALRTYPNLGKQVREIVLMRGSLSGGNMTPAAEFNIYVDPEAANIVFGSGVPLTMVGLDVTRKCILTEEHVRALEVGKNAISKTAARIARNHLRHAGRGGSDRRAMHDPLAVAAFMDRTLVTLQRYFVAIETRGELTAGETVGYREVPIRPSASNQSSSANSEAGAAYVPNANVAVGIDAERFFRIFVGRLSGPSASA
jgi:inosine-uridine nucleoside N-ribohydrolase